MNKVYDLEDFEDFSEGWIFLLGLKNIFGIFLLVVGGVLAWALAGMPFVSGIVPPAFWLSGSWIVLKLNLAPPILDKLEKEDLKWEKMLRSGSNE